MNKKSLEPPAAAPKKQGSPEAAAKKSSGLRQWFEGLLLQVPAQEQLVFIKNLSIMIKSGLPMLESLKMIQSETKSRALKKILASVVDDVSNGQFLSASLRKFQSTFGDLFINVIEVGEASGILSENLNYLAEELKKKDELKKKIIGAMVYPMVILAATVGISGLLVVFIFPKILPIFKNLNVKLPLATKILIAVSNLLTEHGPLVILILFVLLIIFLLLLKVHKVRYWWHVFLLRVPVVSGMMRSANLANFCRTLGSALKSGVKIVEAVSLTAKSTTNLVYKNELVNIAEEIRKGQTIADYLKPNPHLFPGMLAQMVAVGENTGNLSETLLYLSDFYESELTDLSKNLSNILEPALMIFMGLMVGFVAIAIIMPIYEVTTTFNH